jgi:Ca2+ transporting ATPase
VIFDEEIHQTKRLGNATECALLAMAESMGQESQRDPAREILIVPFNSKRKYMLTVYSTDDSKKYEIYVKGAPEILLPHCTKIIGKGGIEKPLKDQKEIESKILRQNARIGYRSLLLAHKTIEAAGFDIEEYQNEDSYAKLEEGLTLIAIVGIEDPLREGVKESVEICKQAGITVRMVTGDNMDYARSIAVQCGIITREEMDPTNLEYKEYGCMLGQDFYREVGGIVKMPDPEDSTKIRDRVGSPEKFAQIARELRVLARSQPEHKYLLITGLKEDPRNVVAVTGDGTNDAPALKKADIGLAMGITGTEVAKEASKIILLDDNFSSIVTALKWGRNIYLCVRKFLQFQLTVNVVALAVAVVSGFAHFVVPPINAIQMLWVNIIMDSFAALALATEPPSEKLLLERPYGKNESILTKSMLRNIVCVAIYQIAVLLAVMFTKPEFILRATPSDDKDFSKLLNTMIFHTFVLMQIFNEIACRRIKSNEFCIVEDFFNNWRFIVIMVITLAVQVLLVQSGVRGINTVALNLEQHGMCVALSFGVIIWGLISKALVPEALFGCMKEEDTVSLSFKL